MSTALLEPLLQTDDLDLAEWFNHPVIDGRPLNRWTPAQFDLMCELGLFDDDEVELFRGVVIRQMTRNTLHDVTLHWVAQGLLPYIPPGWIVRYQAAVIAGQSVLEPDLALVRGPHTLYLKRHPVAGDAGLIIEVSDSSLARDRLKAAEYCRAGADEYWIVNLIQRQLEVFRQPDLESGRFLQQRILRGSEILEVHLKGEFCARISPHDLLPLES